MRHFWVFEQLLDLRSYAQENGFTKLAAKLAEAIKVAHDEIDPKAPGARGPSKPPGRE